MIGGLFSALYLVLGVRSKVHNLYEYYVAKSYMSEYTENNESYMSFWRCTYLLTSGHRGG